MATGQFATKEWKEIITPYNSVFAFNIKEIWDYRDLLIILVKRDISAIYKQTVLGPAWFFIQPILTTATYIIIFSRIAKLSTLGLPPVIFYLSGIILWSYFSECILKTASFLKDNSQIFSKVYFPRLIIPLSLILTNLVKFSIQFGLFVLLYFYFYFSTETIHPSWYIIFIPVLIICTAFLGLGAGIIIASLTIRYKDLSHLITFAIQLLMFVSPVFFPLESMENDLYKKIILLNPMSGFIEAFRYFFTGKGYLDWSLLGYDFLCVLVFLVAGLILFNHTEKTFIDTI